MRGRGILRALAAGPALGMLLYGCTAAGKAEVELSAPPPPQARVRITALLPPASALAGWSRDGEVREFQGRKIFDFLDGAAEVHLTYNFVTVATADYVNEKGQYVTVSIYELTSPADAYGLNSYYSPVQGQPVDVGCDGKVRTGSCRCWKGPYFVAVEGDPVADMDPVAESFARLVTERIPGTCPPPDLVTMLPTQGRKTDPVVFLHKPLILRSLSFQAVAVNPEALGLNERTDMAVAEYEGGFALSVTRYPDSSSLEPARQAYANARVLVVPVGSYLVATTAGGPQAEAAFRGALSLVQGRQPGW